MLKRIRVEKIIASFAVLTALLHAAAVEVPVVRHFDGDHLLRAALPMGGIGCGSISLSGRGELVDWEIMNRANKTMSETERGPASRTFFAIRVKGASHESTTMLAGPIYPTELYAADGNCAPQSGLPRFREATFDGAFPFGVVHLSDSDLPVKVTIKGFSPFIPGDSAASSLPVASLQYDVENLSGEALEVSVAAFVRNIVGNDGNPVGFKYNRMTRTGGEKDNRTAYRERDGLRGILCFSEGVATNSPAWGSIALSTFDADASLTFRESFAPNKWSAMVLDFWDDLSDDGELGPLAADENSEPHGGLCLKKSVPADGKTTFRFVFTWNFPNRPAWEKTGVIVGNFAKQSNANTANALFISGNVETCRALKEQMPGYKVYCVTYIRTKWGERNPYLPKEEIFEKVKASGADGVDCFFDPDYVTDDFVRMFTSAGLEFHVWTVDDLDLALEAFRRGAKTVTTNCAKKLLAEYKAAGGRK